MLDCPPAVSALIRTALREPMVPAAERCRGPALDRRHVEALLPHRDLFLLIDRITYVDVASATIVCQYDLARAASVFEGHFPARPLWPGVLQVEAVGQAGLCMVRLLDQDRGQNEVRSYALTQILGAHFVRPVAPGGELEIVTRLVSDGLFNILVGQCLQQGVVCSASALRGIEKETET